MRGPKVSLVTPSFNHAPFIERTLRSVLCQDYPDIEYIVMDAASTDGTVEVLRRYEAALDVLVVAPDGGQGDALDRGFRMAGGDVLGYLNADDCLASPSTISAVVARLAENPWADLVYGQRHYIGPGGEFVLTYPYRPFDRERLYVADYIPQEATFWTRRIYERAGGHVDATFNYAMDYDLWLRFLRAGGRFLSVPEYWGLFRWYPNQKSQALWRTVGLPECARLHREHLGREVGEQEMCDAFLEALMGAHPRSQPEAYKRFERCWELLLGLHHQALRGKRLDGWVDHAPLNRARLAALERARRAAAA